jgi:hypothetical protein
VTRLPWHVAASAEFERIRPSLEADFPYLHLRVRDGYTILVGDFPIVDSGRVIDSFSIEVTVPPEGTRRAVPFVREVAGRIPPEADRHVSSDGTACLFIEAEYWFKHPDGSDLIEFLHGPVKTYFVAQLFFEQEGRWPFGQRAHGAAGDLEFYGPLFGSRDARVIRAFLEMVAARKLRSTWRCPCGSGHRLWGCHDNVVRRLRARIRRAAVISSLRRIDRELLPSTRRIS